MKALILGASGQVGRALAATAPKGVRVTALDREQCDVTRAGAIGAAISRARPHLVFNAAAYTAVDRAESDVEAAHKLNAIAPELAAIAVREFGARLIHISTDFVFDGKSCEPLTPLDTPNPLGVYGRTKLAGERAVLATLPSALIVRTAWVYAAHGANFVSTMLRLMGERDVVNVVSDQIGTPTHAISLAEALWALATKDAVGIYHYTDSGVASWYDFAVAIQEEAACLGLAPAETRVRPIASLAYPTPAPRPSYSVLDKAATWNLLGEEAPHWRVNLRACLQELSNV